MKGDWNETGIEKRKESIKKKSANMGKRYKYIDIKHKLKLYNTVTSIDPKFNDHTILTN